MHRARRHQLCQKLCTEFARTRLLRNASNFKKTFPFHFSTFIFYKVLSKILQHIEHIEIATTYLEIAKKKKIQTFCCQEKKNPPLILQDASNSTKGLKAFQSSIHKNYQKCWFRMTGSYVFD